MKDGIIKAILITIAVIVIGVIVAVCYYSNRLMNAKYEELFEKTEITDEEKKNIEKYLSRIYLNTLIVDKEDTLPEFNSIEEARDDWILNCIYNNLEIENETFSISQEIVNKYKVSLFGDIINKPLANKDRYGHMIKNKNGGYNVYSKEKVPEYFYYYIIDEITKNDKEIKISLIEYKTNVLKNGDTSIKVYTRDGTDVLALESVTDMDEEGNSESDKKITAFVRENYKKFTKATVTLEKQDDGTYIIKSVEREN